MTATWQPYRERVWVTIARTFAIAIVLAALTSRWMGGGMAGFAKQTVIMLWPALGGHFVEIFFLNWLRPRLAPDRGVQMAMRLLVWFICGTILALCMGATAVAFGRHPPFSRLLAFGGVAFIFVELIAHLFLQLRGRPSFYNGRG
jgi:hypothetical protein